MARLGIQANNLANNSSMGVQENISLQSLNSFGIQVKARYYSLIQDIPTLYQLLRNQQLQSLPKLILGGGTNLLLTKDFEGWVIQIAITGLKKLDEDRDHVWLQVGAGFHWHALVVSCVQKGYAGIENLSLIPGTVGAAPIQNIGAYGVEFSEVFESLTALEISTGILKTFSKKDCAFGYRNSIFKSVLQGQYIILQVVLCLKKQPRFRIEYGTIQETLAAMQVDQLSLQAISNAIIQIRQSKLPDTAKLGNAGSFFKNPIVDTCTLQKLQSTYPSIPYYSIQANQAKLSAAWLIEQAGWKGYRQGQVGVHPKQALVIINHGQATGQAIYQLAKKIQQDIQAQFSVTLEPEVNII